MQHKALGTGETQNDNFYCFLKESKVFYHSQSLKKDKEFGENCSAYRNVVKILERDKIEIK